MSTALDRNGNTGNSMIQRSGRFIHGLPCTSIYDTKGFYHDRRLEFEEDSSNSRSSSVGNDSDDEPNGSSKGKEAEVQSSFNGALDIMDQLEEVLPIKRGISKFYDGKSKSFTSLADALSISTLKELARPVDSYNKKLKKLKFNCGGIRRTASSSRPPRHPYRKRSPGNGSSDSSPPSPPEQNAPWRSFSLSDLRCTNA